MKKTYLILSTLLCSLFVACMDSDWDEPAVTVSPYGNNAITEDGIVDIEQLKNDPDYQQAISMSRAKLVDKNIKIRGRITGNDIGGNLYKQFALQDASGAIVVAVNQSGMSGFLAEGQEIIIDMKGLYIGANGSQPQIGAPYEGSVGRMSKNLWATHFKVVGTAADVNPKAIQPVDFETIMGDLRQAGKLVTVKNARFVGADGKKTFLDGEKKGGNYYNSYISINGENIIVRVSSYADFAATVLPTGPCNITGIAMRFGNDWQIMMRKTSDLEVVKNQ